MSNLPLLKLRQDLHFSFQSYSGNPCYLVEDTLNDSYFQIGELEYQFLHYLDGKTPIEQILLQMPMLSTEQAQLICQYAIQSQIVYLKTEQGWQLANPPKMKAAKLFQTLNILFIKIPLGSPDRWLSALLPYCRWMLGWGFFAVWLFLVISGGYLVANQFYRFSHAASNLLLPNNFIWLGVAWTIIKVLHETFHGLVCKKYGGFVQQAGIMLILFVPLGAYVNVTSSWKLRSKWQRIHISVAGIYLELLLSSLAAWVWSYTETGVINYLAYNIIVIAAIGTILFNANPLMRFDGYYILSDLLNMPNLYLHGQKYIRYLNRRYLQGHKENSPTDSIFIKVYALCSLVWRWLVIFSLFITSLWLWHGAGVVIAILSLLSILVLPLSQFFKNLNLNVEKNKVIKQLSLRLTILSIIVLVVLTQVSWSPRLSAPAVIDYQPSVTVRAETAGFVATIAVKNGEQVAENQLLMVLENPELVSQQRDIALQVQISELKKQQLFNKNELAASQAEEEKLKAFRAQLADLNFKVEHLKIHAPLAGTVIADNLTDFKDLYVKRGVEILTIANPNHLEVKISIPQEEVEAFRANVNQTIWVYLDANPTQAIPTLLDRVNPSASQTILYPALTVLGGGLIPVKPKTEEQRKIEKNNEMQYEYLKPHFDGRSQLPNPAAMIKAGQTAKVMILSPPRTLGYSLYVTIERYLQKLLENKNIHSVTY